MKKGPNFLVLILIGITTLVGAMDVPKKSKGIFVRAKEFVVAPLTSQKATEKLVKLLNSKDEQLTLKDLQLLIEKGADINATNKEGKTALTKALEQGVNVGIIDLLVKNGAYIQDSIFLVNAAEDNNIQKVLLLIKAGANVDKQNKTGFGALYWAIYHKNYEMVQELIKAEADVNIETNSGFTPLMAAIGSLSSNPKSAEQVKKIISLLLRNGAIIDEKVFEKARQGGSEKLLKSLQEAPKKLKKKLR